ncbi:MAG: hypothetical protein M1497_15185 [Nitrospirae bacterium]|nr:hypothetical protein [Nitrospirota bacterium]
MRIISRFFVVFVVTLLIVPSVAQGDLRQFIPRIWSTEAEVDVDASYESNTNTSGTTAGLNTRDTFASERFVYSTTGWIYHPRFIVFLGKIGLGVNEENFTNEKIPGSGGWRTSFLYEYEFRAVVLPEHPYNLEVYTLRRNPYVKGRITSGISTIGYDSGAVFRFKQRPYKFSLGYDYSILESDRYTTHTKTLKTNASYFKDWGSFSGGYSHANADTTSLGFATDYTSDDYSFENQLQFFKRKVYFTTNVSGNIFKQNSSLASLDDRRFAGTEQVSIELPWNFTTNLFYSHYEDDAKNRDHETGVQNELDSKSDNAGFSVLHKLYQSLTTAYSFNYIKTSSNTGDSDGTTQSLTSNYIKNIPIGTLVAGVAFSRSVIDRTGAASVVNEGHNAQIFGEFSLQQPDIDDSSIVIRVKAPDTGVLVDMTRDVHYLVYTIGNTIRIKIIAIPPEALSPDPFFQYQFLVTYSLVEEQVKLKTTTFGYSVRLELFDHLVNPFYSYSHSDQEVVSGILNGIPAIDTSHIVGVEFQKAPFQLLVEYQDYQSTVNPFKMFRAEGTYRKDLTETFNVYARAYYSRTRRELVLSQPGGTLTETVAGGDLRLQKSFPKQNLWASLGGSYFQTTGIGTTRTYLLDGVLTWRAGNLYVSAGANVGRAEQQLTTNQDSLYQYYYLSVRRKIL